MTTTHRHEASGADLAKEIAQPHVTDFREVFDFATTDKAKAPEPRYIRGEDMDGKYRATPVGPYCIHRDQPAMWVQCSDWVLSRLSESMLILEGDTIHFEVVDHDNGWSLVIASHGVIIGDRWLAYVRTETVKGGAK